MSEKKGRRIWSKRVTWVLLHAVHFFQTYREVGELEIKDHAGCKSIEGKEG